jgi:hypothetical protein
MAGHGRKRKKGKGRKKSSEKWIYVPICQREGGWGNLLKKGRDVHETCGHWRRRAKIDIREKLCIQAAGQIKQ